MLPPPRVLPRAVALRATPRPGRRRADSARATPPASNARAGMPAPRGRPPRRTRTRGDDVDALPRVAEDDLGVEQRVDDPVQLHDPGARQQPVQVAAEGEQADAVLAL